MKKHETLKRGWSDWLGDSFAPDELKALKSGMEEALAAYSSEREKRLWDAVMMLEGGRRPSNEEVARRGRRVIWPDGKVEWLWDKTIILTEPSPTERWRRGGGESPNNY